MADGEDRATARTKKVNVRRAHRASVTRLIAQIDGATSYGDMLKLRQLKQSLTNKLNVLAGLDDEVLEETELEGEVEQADLVREKIDFAIFSINDALASLNTTEPPGRYQTNSSSSSGEEGRSSLGSPPDLEEHPTVTYTPVSSVIVTTVEPTGALTVFTGQPLLPSITTTNTTLLYPTLQEFRPQPH